MVISSPRTTGQDRDGANGQIDITGHDQHRAGNGDDPDHGDLQQHDVEIGPVR